MQKIKADGYFMRRIYRIVEAEGPITAKEIIARWADYGLSPQRSRDRAPPQVNQICQKLKGDKRFIRTAHLHPLNCYTYEVAI